MRLMSLRTMAKKWHLIQITKEALQIPYWLFLSQVLGHQSFWVQSFWNLVIW
jgi:hypothetical protein